MRWIWIMAAMLMLAGPAMANVSQLDSAAGVIDTVRPTVAFSLEEPTPTALNAVHFSADFSESVSATFDASDVTLTGTLVGAATLGVEGTDPNYTVTVTMNNPEDDGTIGIQIGTGVTDLVGNACAGGVSGLYQIHNWHGFTQQPAGANLYVGDNYTLTVAASYGNSTPVYQWKFDNGSTVQNVGTNAPTYGVTGVMLSQGGSYWSEITYDVGVYESDHAAINVVNPLVVTMADPAIVRVYAGEDHTLAATVTGGFVPLARQWMKDGGDLSGETGASYAIVGARPGNVGMYALRVTDAFPTTRTSTSTQVLVADHLQITADPVGAIRAIGGDYTFTVSTSGGFPTVSYQWSRNASTIADATDNQLTVASIQPSSEGNYAVEVRDAGGDVLTSQAALLHVVGPLAILQGPQSARAYAGESHTFTVETTGGALPLHYQWRKDASPISGATDSSYTIGAVGSTHAGNYSVVVNDADSASETSGDGALAVAAHLQITSPPASAQEVVGASHTFTVTAIGGFAPLTYVWKKNGVEILGATAASYSTPPLTLSDSVTFTVEISDANNDTRTASADLTVTQRLPVADLLGLGALFGLITISGARRMRKK